MTLVLAMLLAQACTAEFVCRSGDQDVSGHKTFNQLALFPASYDVGGVGVGVCSPSGVATRYITPASDNQGIVLRGRRGWGDPAAAVSIERSRHVDGGSMLTIFSGGQPIFDVGNDSVQFGGSVNADGTSGHGGSLVDVNGYSGHTALTRIDGLYLFLTGAQGSRDDLVNADGSPPVCDGGSWTRETANGCRWNYAGDHGDVTYGSRHPMRAGLLAQLYNPLSGTGARTDYRAAWDVNGAYSQGHMLPRSAFPGLAVKVATNLGEAFFGAKPGAQYWAHDTERWYFMKPDAGDFVQFAEQPSVDALLSRVVAAEARIAALEAACP